MRDGAAGLLATTQCGVAYRVEGSWTGLEPGHAHQRAHIFAAQLTHFARCKSA